MLAAFNMNRPLMHQNAKRPHLTRAELLCVQPQRVVTLADWRALQIQRGVAFKDVLTAYVCITTAAFAIAYAHSAFPDISGAWPALARVFQLIRRKTRVREGADTLGLPLKVQGHIELRCAPPTIMSCWGGIAAAPNHQCRPMTQANYLDVGGEVHSDVGAPAPWITLCMDHAPGLSTYAFNAADFPPCTSLMRSVRTPCLMYQTGWSIVPCQY
jgi:hypothetical protein